MRDAELMSDPVRVVGDHCTSKGQRNCLEKATFDETFTNTEEMTNPSLATTRAKPIEPHQRVHRLRVRFETQNMKSAVGRCQAGEQSSSSKRQEPET